VGRGPARGSIRWSDGGDRHERVHTPPTPGRRCTTRLSARTGLATVVALVSCLLAACGNTSTAAISTGSTSGHGNAASAGAPSAGATAGCGLHCNQAGAGGGPGPQFKPASLPYCPNSGCIKLLTTSALVHGGAFVASVRCAVAQPCNGTLELFSQGGTDEHLLAESPIRVLPKETANVEVDTTAIGTQLAASARGVTGRVLIPLTGWGNQGSYFRGTITIHG
jgi:hypothetical protein